MPSSKIIPVASTALLLVSASLLGFAQPASAADPLSFAVIGDVPYGDSQFSSFPGLIDQINADPDVQLASHVGDISSPLNCTDDYYATIRSQFDRFADPLVYTPGDNEWTDCSRATYGAANPLDRLASVRSHFFPAPGMTLGVNKMAVTAQSGFPENVLFDKGGVTFAAVHVVGSNNDLIVWTGENGQTPEQKAEVTARTNADITLIHSAFSQATTNGSRAVALLMQADMFAPGGTPNDQYKLAFQSIVQSIATDSRNFAKPVFLINGDTHSFVSDKPLTSSSWLTFYGAGAAVPNLSRITIKGGSSEWTKFTVVPDASVLTVARIPLGATPTPPANMAPTAAFTSSVNGLAASVNGSGSTDADGTVTSYAWNFGDGNTATGATASHTYATAGTKTITLTVTDNAGATGTVSHAVTVGTGTPPPPPADGTTLAKDTFARTVAGGLGTAETGGAWTTSGTASDFAVNNGVAKITVPAGTNRYAYLNSVSSTDTDLSTTLSFARPTASTVYTALIGRRVGTATYGARVVVGTSGSVLLQLQSNFDQALKSATVAGLSYSTGDQLQFRLQVTGTNPTTIQAKVWKTGTTEPATWQLTTTDSTAGLQAAGGIGLHTYLSRTATPNQTMSYDNLTATSSTAGPVEPPVEPPANTAPVAAFTSSVNGLAASVNGSGSTDADGTVASYAWNFGDGNTATGATASHTYATAGAKTITLTVTDNAGASGAVSHAVTVTAPTPPPPPADGTTLAKDAFARTVAGGLGTAETGGAWTTSGTASDFAVNNGVAKITVPAGTNRYAYLNSVSSTDTDLSTTLSFIRPTASTVYTALIGRRVGTATYGARIVVGTSGSVLLQLQHDFDQILKSGTIAGLSYNTGDQLQFRLQVTGTSPTTIQAKVWKTGTTEPATWHLTTTDSTAGLQAAGGIGLHTYLGRTAAPTQTVTYDNLTATTTQ